jgi:type II secretory pathway component PulF
MRFTYQARTKDGEVKTGIVESSTKEAALSLLEKYGLYVTLLEEAKLAPLYSRKLKFLERVSRGEIVSFSRQLAILFKSRIPIVEIFYTLGRQTKNEIFREKIVDIAEVVEAGGPLSSALSRHPTLFNQFYISMVKSGEVSGNLPEVLDYLADHLEKDSDFRSQIVGAMIYPVIVLIVVVLVVAAMVLFVIPRLGEIIKEMGVEPPIVTRIVLQFSAFARQWGLWLIIGFIALIIFLFRFSKSDRGKKIFDKAFLRLPIVGTFLQKVYLTRFAENLATLISGGVSISQALEVTADIVGNDVFKTIILEARDGVRKGDTMSTILEAHPEYIPPLFTQMTLVGERAGQISEALRGIVGFYQKDVDRTLENFVSFLEPLLIVFLGIVVALLVVSVLMPIYQIGLGEGL